MQVFMIFGALALLAPVGLAVYTAGVTRAKNAAGTVMRSTCSLCVAVLVTWAIGLAILGQQHNGVFWIDRDMLFADAGGWAMFLIVAIGIAAIAATGSLGERSTFFPVLAASALVAGLIVPVAGNWVIHGWLARRGFIDMAGGSYLHVAAGAVAAVGAKFVGARQGKYHRDGSTSVIPGHSLPLAGIGVLLVIPGWIAYVCGFAALSSSGAAAGADRAALNVLLCAASGGVASLLYGQFRYGKSDVLLALLGVMGALVAATAGAAVIPTPASVFVGAVAGLIVPYAAVWIDVKARIDDPVGAVAVHAVGGAWGTLAVGLFAAGHFVDRLKQVGMQALGVVAVAALAMICAAALFAAIRATGRLRAKEADEFDGLDLAQHDIGAYPDFQQNTIRSYHLRET